MLLSEVTELDKYVGWIGSWVMIMVILWVGLGWVCQSVGWVGLSDRSKKKIHPGQLCANSFLRVIGLQMVSADFDDFCVNTCMFSTKRQIAKNINYIRLPEASRGEILHKKIKLEPEINHNS